MRLRRVGVSNPVFVLDEIDRLDEGSGVAAALLEALASAPGAPFRDRYVDLPFDLSEALFVATANSLGSITAVLRERMTVVELSGYTEAEKRIIAVEHLLPLQMTHHGLTPDEARVTEEAVRRRAASRVCCWWSSLSSLTCCFASEILRGY